MELKTAWEQADLEEKKELLANERRQMDERIQDARDQERAYIIQDAMNEINDTLLLYYTVEDSEDLERARKYFKAYEAIGLLTRRDWVYLNTRVKNLAVQVEAKEWEAARKYRDSDAAKAEKKRQWEMKDKIPGLKR